MTITVREKGKTSSRAAAWSMTSDMWLAPKIRRDEGDRDDGRGVFRTRLTAPASHDGGGDRAMYPMMKDALAR